MVRRADSSIPSLAFSCPQSFGPFGTPAGVLESEKRSDHRGYFFNTMGCGRHGSPGFFRVRVARNYSIVKTQGVLLPALFEATIEKSPPQNRQQLFNY
jgi:hypothetical protein